MKTIFDYSSDDDLNLEKLDPVDREQALIDDLQGKYLENRFPLSKL